MAKDEKLAGVKKAAILLMSLDRSTAAVLLSKMDPKYVEDISLEIARLDEVEQKQRDKIIQEFYQMNIAYKYMARGGFDFAKGLLAQSLPPGEAERIMKVLQASVHSVPFQFLEKVEANSVLTFIQDEHPQTIALIIAHMPEKRAAELLAGLVQDKKVEVMKRIAMMERTNPDVVHQVEHTLEQKLSGMMGQEVHETGGVKAAADILNLVDRATERGILEQLEEEDPDLADQIRRLMFTFDDITLVDDRGIQRVLMDIETKDLATALKTATEEVKEKVFSNLSKRKQETLKEEIEYLGPVRVSDVEQAQQQIVEVIRKLEEAVIAGRGEGGTELV